MVKFLSYSTRTVVPYSRDRYEIIGLLNISHSIKQPCSSVCLKKSTRNASKMFKQCSTFVKQNEKLKDFDLQQAFKMSYFAQNSPAYMHVIDPFFLFKF